MFRFFSVVNGKVGEANGAEKLCAVGTDHDGKGEKCSLYGRKRKYAGKGSGACGQAFKVFFA